MEGFKEGYSFASRTGSFQYVAATSEEYVAEVEQEIGNLLNDLVDLARSNAGKENKILGGDIAEIWHEGTFNINAAAKQSADHATANRYTGLGSPDVVLDSGAQYSLKYYATAEGSAKAQAVTAFEEYKRNGGKKTIEEYLKLHPEFSREQAIGDPLYADQYRLIPEDHLEEAKKWLRRKYLEESYRDDGQAQRYQDVLNMLAESDGHAVIDNGNGIRSVPLSKKQSTELAQLAKENNIDPQKWGLTIDKFIKFEDVLRGSFKAGLSAATIDAILKLAPEIYKALAELIKNGRVDPEELKLLGLTALKGAEQGFFIGSISYAIITTCKAGMLGPSLKTINPHIVGIIAVIAYDTIGNGIKVARGELSEREMLDVFISESFISAFALAGGSLLSTGLGATGYLLGSFVGSIIGGIAYQTGKRIFIAFCIESGFTLFGLVSQDYTLPESVIREIGGDIFELNEFEVDEFEPVSSSHLNHSVFEPDQFQIDTITIQPLRRGVLSVSQVAYI